MIVGLKDKDKKVVKKVDRKTWKDSKNHVWNSNRGSWSTIEEDYVDVDYDWNWKRIQGGFWDFNAKDLAKKEEEWHYSWSGDDADIVLDFEWIWNGDYYDYQDYNDDTIHWQGSDYEFFDFFDYYEQWEQTIKNGHCYDWDWDHHHGGFTDIKWDDWFTYEHYCDRGFFLNRKDRCQKCPKGCSSCESPD